MVTVRPDGANHMAITPKQQRFVDEYLVDLNATQAAIRAGYSAKTAEQQGPRLLGNVGVQAAIVDRQKALQKSTQITQKNVIDELAKIAFGDRRNLMKWGPSGVTLVDSTQISPDDAAAVCEVSETINLNGGSLKLKTHDKVKALELLGKHLGLFTDKVEITGKDGGPMEHTTVTPGELSEAVRSVRDTY